ncbi:MAG: hypothetical protein GY757_04385, partial [bacterium]|nr:hypothetical protein [bacterium]
PLTSNGKIDRKTLYELHKKSPLDELSQIAPRDETEKKLVTLWSQVLDREVCDIGIDTNFFQIGGHSLNATILTAVIHRELNIKVPLADIFQTPTIRGLAKYIRGLEENKYTSLQPAEKKSFYPLSSAQKRLYILQQMEPEGTAYNMPQTVPMVEEPDLEKLENTIVK